MKAWLILLMFLVLPAWTVQPASCTAPPPGLVTWWSGDGIGSDLMGSHPATLRNGVTYGAGMVGRSFTFDGVDDYLEVPAGEFLYPGTNSFSVTFWLKTSQVSGFTTIFSQYDSAGALGGEANLEMFLDGGRLRTYLRDLDGGGSGEGGNQELFSTRTVADGQFHFIVWQRDLAAGRMRIYLDGALDADASLVGPTGLIQDGDGESDSFLIGASYPGGTAQPWRFFSGQIDEFAVFHHALTSNEIAAIHAASSAGMCRPEPVCVPPPSGLVAWWPGEGNANDIFGGNHGALKNSAATSLGNVGKAFWFDGIDDGIFVTNANGIFDLTNSWTVQAWVKPSAPGVDFRADPIVWKVARDGNAPTEDTFSLSWAGGNRFTVAMERSSDDFSYQLTSAAHTPGRWYHVVGEYDGESLHVFVDGMLEGTLNIGPVIAYTGPAPLRIGTLLGTSHLNAGSFNGLIDEVAIHNRALTSNEIAAIYAAGSAGMCKPQCIAAPPGVVAWWPGDGDAGDLITGSSGTLGNGASTTTGMVDQAFTLDGVNDFVEIPNSMAPKLSGAMTITAWVKPLRLGGAIVTKYDSSNDDVSWYFTINRDGRLRFGVEGSDAYRYADTASAVIFPEGYTHVTATFDPLSQSLRIYANGTEVDAPIGFGSTAVTSIYASATAVRIGVFRNVLGDLDSFFYGTIDEVTMWNRALSSNEIAAIYAAGSAGMCKPSSPPSIVAQPTNVTVNAYEPAQLAITATGVPPPAYQWRYNGAPLVGQSNSVLVLTNVQPWQAGGYDVVVSNVSGSVTSQVARIFVVPQANPVCINPPPGLVAWWPGDGNANDVVGPNNGASLGLVTFSESVVASGFQFSSQFGEVAIGSPVANEPPITVCAWVKDDQSFGNAYVLANGGENSGGFGFFLYRTSDFGVSSWAFGARSRNQRNATIAFSPVLSTGFSFLCGIWDPGGAGTQLFVDGLASTNFAPLSYAAGANAYSLTIGGPSIPNCCHWNGGIDEVQIFNRALTSNEIAAIYAAGSAGMCKPPSPPSIVAQPTSVTVNAYELAQLAITATGVPLPEYQWRYDGAQLIGQSNSVLVLTNTQPWQAGNYDVVVANASGAVTSTVARVTVLPATNPVCSLPPPGLVAWWQGDGNASEVTGRFVGTPIGHPSYAAGQVSQALAFDGAEDYIDLGEPDALKFTQAEFTIAGWIKMDGLPAKAGRQCAPRYPIFGFDWGYGVEIREDGRLYLHNYSSTSSKVELASLSPLSDAKFHHFAAIRSKAGLLIFVDGRLDASLAAVNLTAYFQPGDSLKIGGVDCGGDTFYFKGLIDELGVWNRALTSDEIASMYAVGSAGMCNESCVSAVQNLLAWWPGDFSPVDTKDSSKGQLVGGARYLDGRLGGGSFRFDGNGDAVVIPETVASDLSRRPTWTISAWIMPERFNNSTWPTIFAEGHWRISLGLNRQNGSLSSWINNENPIYSTVAPTLGSWSHVALVYDGKSRVFYVNGENAGSGNAPAVGPDSDGAGIGRVPDNRIDSSFQGRIDDVALFGVALSAYEIRQLYFGQTPVDCRQGNQLAIITQQPTNQIVEATRDVVFNVTAEAVGILSYQWFFNGVIMPGATNAVLSLPLVTTNQSGAYYSVVANNSGAITSRVAALTVLPDNTPPNVTRFTPVGTVNHDVSRLYVQFDERIRSETFTPGAVKVQTPGGILPVSAVTVEPVLLSDGTAFEIVISNQSGEGEYQVQLSPYIQDLAGNPMAGSTLVEDQRFSTPSGAWTLRGSAEWNAGGFVRLTPANYFQLGSASFAPAFPKSAFLISYDFRMLNGGGSSDGDGPGADGIAFVVSEMPQTEAFFTGPGSGRTLFVWMDSYWGNAGDIASDHITIYPAQGGSNQSQSPLAPRLIDTGTWHAEIRYDGIDQLFVEVRSGGGNVTRVAQQLIEIQCPNEFHFGFGSYTGGAFANQEIDNIQIRLLPTDSGSEGFQSRFSIDKSGPKIVGMQPVGGVSNTVRFVDVTFNEAIDVASLKPETVAILGPSAPSVTGWQTVGSNVYRATFSAPLNQASYDVVIGPRITDIAGNAMDQNGNRVNGEVGVDAFVGHLVVNLPDLSVVSLEAPGTGFAGQPVPLSWTITNRGPGILSGASSTRVSLASNANGENAVTLGHFVLTNSLARGQSAAQQISVILPSSLSGPRWFVISADAGESVLEAVETNNTLVASAPIEIASPDLEISVLTSASSAVMGQSVNIRYVVRNRGSAPTRVAWSDTIGFSKGNGSLAGASVLGTAAAPQGLEPGESYTNTVRVTLPFSSALLPGNYFILVQADASNAQPESDESNNTASLPITLNYPPRPDLLISSISSVTNAAPGQPIAVTWTVTNAGPAAALAPWTETILLVGNDITNVSNLAELQNRFRSAATLGTFVYSNALPPGAFLTRTQFVSLPLNGLSGDTRLVATIDARDEVFEEKETNNVVLASDVLRIPLSLSLQLSSSQVAEDASVPLRVTLTRNGSLSEALSVTVTNSDPSELSSVPAGAGPSTTNVTIAAGQSVLVLTLYPVQDHVVDSQHLVTVAATATGYESASASVTVLNSDLPILTLSVESTSVSEGLTLAMTVRRDVVTPNPVVVSLSSSSPGQLSPPSVVTIPGGQAATTFAVLAVDDVNAEATGTYSVSASTPGFNSGVASVTVVDNDLPTLTVNLSAHSVSEGAGAQALSMTVTRNPAGQGALNIEPFAGDPSLLNLPLRITISPGQASRSFPIGVIDDALVNGPRTTTVGAYALAAGSGAHLSEAIPDALTVTDDDGPTLKLVASTKLVREGLKPATSLTLTRNTPATNALEATLISSRPGEATLPSSVIIPVGATSISVPLVSVADGVPDGNQSVTLTASAPDFTSASETVVVSDTDLPDLLVASISAPSSGTPLQTVSVSYRVANQGLSGSQGEFRTRVFLSKDPIIGDDILVAQSLSSIGLEVGKYFEATEQIILPATVGNYWVVVETDAELVLPEVLENNNSQISAFPIAVGADYGAWVRTDVVSTNAGASIPLYGRATNELGAGMAGKTVNLHVLVRGTQRILSATTDASGNFTATFVPLPGEAGRYDLFATHPGVGTVAVQDSFSLLGFRANPSSVSLTVVEGATRSGSVSLENQSDVPLTGANVSVVSKPTNLGVTAAVTPGTIAGLGASALNYSVTAATADAYGTVQLRVTTAEGVSQDIYLGVNVEPLRPRLVVTPVSLYAAMPVGGQAVVDFDISNLGGRESGPITLSLPGVPWMHLATTNPMPSLAPGQTNHVTLVLTPSKNLPLGPYTGSLAVNASNTGTTVPFNFRAMSVCVGDLRVEAVDEFTYFAEGGPKLSDASVSILDSVTKATVASGVTDTSGSLLVGPINEGYYDVEVSADKHTAYRGVVLIRGGVTNEIQAFLSRQTVTYTWTVAPVELEDRYRVSVEAQFETVVPAPVVLVEPSSFDLGQIASDEAVLELKISNRGLVAAEGASIEFPTHPNWEISPLVKDLGALPANSSLTVPVRVRKRSSGQRVGLAYVAEELAPCSYSGCVNWSLLCGPKTNYYCSGVGLVNARRDCGPSGEGIVGPGRIIPTSDSGPGDGSPTRPYLTSPAIAPLDICDCGLIPKLCFKGEKEWELEEVAKKVAARILKKIPAARIMQQDIKFSISGEVCTCCKNGSFSWESEAKITAEAEFEVHVGPGFAAELPKEWKAPVPWQDVEVEGSAVLGFPFKLHVKVEGSYGKKCAKDSKWCLSAFGRAEVFGGAAFNGKASAKATVDHETGPGNIEVRIAEFSGEVSGEVGLRGVLQAQYEWCSDTNGVGTVCGNLIAVGHLTGELETTIGSEKFKKEIGPNLDVDLLGTECKDPDDDDDDDEESGGDLAAIPSLASLGLDDTLLPNTEPESELLTSDWMQKPDSNLIEALDLNRPPRGTCARVKLRLEQEAIMARDGFRATLELDNNTPSRLEDVLVSVAMRTESGFVDTNLFSVRSEGVITLSAVDGSGILAGYSKGTAKWLIIPTVDAAPTAATRFFVGGTLSYRLDGKSVIVPLTDVPITVLPSPRLTLKYFHQRDVFSDDPFTPVIEPSVPYSLAVMVQNRGYGEARNFRISSAQPKIIRTADDPTIQDKGLLIDFNIIATEVAGKPVSPSLTVNFGNIGAGQTALGRWLLTSSLQGLFTEYKATWEHIDGLGNPRLSLIDDVTIHEMNHLVQAGGVWEDGKPDFLVNQVSDIHDYPDTLYQSNGSTNFVDVVEQGAVIGTLSPGNLKVNLHAPMPVDWAYLRLPDPGDGLYRLTRVTRSDGLEISVNTNVWTTDRTFIGKSQAPVRENILHLLDYNSPGTYTLTYEPGGTIVIDTKAPVSSVASLPAASRPYFQVSWTGEDLGELGQTLSGIAYYDIYVSENNGPFLPWLQKTRLVSATYIGKPNTRYAFYSIATDANGNREADPSEADTETLVSIRNQAPSIVLPERVVIDEGQTLDLPFSVSDPDADQVLSVSLSGNPPAGVLLNGAERRLTWSTGEGNGPSTNVLTLIVRDNDFESMSATGRVTVVVNELNSAPTLDPIEDAKLSEGQELSFSAIASDRDLPTQPLRFSLGAGAPAGASIGVLNGLFKWRPSDIQGGKTNRVQVIVQDNGQPSLTATQSFNVVVRDTSPDFDLRLGTTNVLAGASNQVPVQLHSGLELTSVHLRVPDVSEGLSNFSLGNLAGGIGAAVVSPDKSNGLLLSLTAAAGQLLPGDGVLATLQFAAPVREHSVIVPLPVDDLQGVLIDGSVLRNGRGTGGRVFVIGDEPLLDSLLETNGVRSLVLYGQPGRRFEIQSKAGLASALAWETVRTVDLVNTWDLWSGLPVSAGQVFYRAIEVPSTVVDGIGTVSRLEDGRLEFRFTGIPQRRYVVEASSNLEQWTPVSTNAGPAGFTTPTGSLSGYKFFRVKAVP